MSTDEKIAIENLADGAGLQLINEALDAAWENIADPNTAAKTTRKVVLEIALTPDASREIVIATITCTRKFAGDAGVVTRVLLGFSGREVVATEIRSRPTNQTDLETYTENVVQMKKGKKE